MREKGRSFLLGFVPTLCVWGLIAGLLTVWVNTQSVLTPKTPLEFSEPERGAYVLIVFGEEVRWQLPELPFKAELFSRYPILIPRSVRLAAWGIENGMERLPEGWRQELEGVLFG